MLEIAFRFVPADPSECPGWLMLTFRSGPRRLEVKCSWLSDTPRDVLRALLRLVEVSGQADICSFDERFYHVFRLRRSDALLTIAAKRFSDVAFQDIHGPLVNKADEEMDWGQVPLVRSLKARFHAEGDFKEAAGSLLRSVQDMLATAGSVETYQRWWGHPYPHAELDRLRAGLASL